MPNEHPRNGTGAPAAFVRALPLLAAWWAIGDDRPGLWWVGVPVVAAATAASLWLSPPRPHGRWRLGPLAVFLPWFAWRSVHGGLDVARRALAPRRPIAPSLVHYPLRLPPDSPAALFFVALVGLVPGTLAADLDGAALTVHALSGSPQAVTAELGRLEAKVAALHGHPLPASSEPPS